MPFRCSCMLINNSIPINKKEWKQAMIVGNVTKFWAWVVRGWGRCSFKCCMGKIIKGYWSVKKTGSKQSWKKWNEWMRIWWGWLKQIETDSCSGYSVLKTCFLLFPSHSLSHNYFDRRRRGSRVGEEDVREAPHPAALGKYGRERGLLASWTFIPSNGLNSHKGGGGQGVRHFREREVKVAQRRYYASRPGNSSEHRGTSTPRRPCHDTKLQQHINTGTRAAGRTF